MRSKLLPIGGLLVLMVLYVWVKTTGPDFYTNDQGFYMYASRLAAEGVLPYRDFFFSHPPLQIALSTIFIFIFGINFTILNLLPAIISLLSGLLIFLICRTDRSGESTLFALLAAAFFLFSCVQIGSALAYTGHNLALLLLLCSTLAFLRKREWMSGVLAGCAMLAGTHAIVGFAALICFQFLWRKKKLPHMLGGFLITLAIGYGIGYAVAGWDFFEQTYMYHLTKPANELFIKIKWGSLTMFFKSELHLILLGTAGIIMLVRKNLGGHEEYKRDPRVRLLSVSALMAAVFALFILLQTPLFLHYTLPLVAWISISAAYVMVALLRVLCRCHNRLTRALPVMVFAVILGVFFFGKTMHEKSFRELDFSHARAVSNMVKELLPDGGTLYGDFGVVPTVALLTGERIAAYEVDSSAMRILSGQLTVEEIWERIEADSVGLFLTREGRGISSYPRFREELERRFFIAHRVGTPTGRGMVIEIWQRR